MKSAYLTIQLKIEKFQKYYLPIVRVDRLQVTDHDLEGTANLPNYAVDTPPVHNESTCLLPYLFAFSNMIRNCAAFTILPGFSS
jgi:hypothetical protein